MHFSSWTDFWAMGGYGFYVWLSFGLTLLVVLISLVDSIVARRRILAKVRAEAERKARIRQSRGQS